MKKILTSLATVSLLSSMALAGDYYGGVDFAFGKGSTETKFSEQFLNIENDFSNTALGIHGGYFFNMNSKIEISFKSLKFDFDDAETDATQFGVDYIYSFDEVSKLTPYIGGGISLNSLDIKVKNKDSIDGVGLTLRGGAYYSLTPQLDIGLEFNTLAKKIS